MKQNFIYFFLTVAFLAHQSRFGPFQVDAQSTNEYFERRYNQLRARSKEKHSKGRRKGLARNLSTISNDVMDYLLFGDPNGVYEPRPDVPSSTPTAKSSTSPVSTIPSKMPSAKPSTKPSDHPTVQVSSEPTLVSSVNPTQTLEQLNYVGWCSARNPCAQCEGQCWNDDHCEEDLECFIVGENKVVPSCRPGNYTVKSGVGYCFDPTVTFPPLSIQVECTKDSPCGVCSGHCKSDDECEYGSKCKIINGTAEVPGCKIQDIQMFDGHGICLDHFMPKLPLHHIGDCSIENPCDRCIGDCDGDHQCQPGLKCFQRNWLEDIPGCQSGGLQAKDYCFEPYIPAEGQVKYPESYDSLTYNGECNFESQCGKCEGDCDNDDDCFGYLECFQRRSTEIVPGCIGNTNGDIGGKDYCYMPLSGRNITNMLNIVDKCDSTSPCGECEGKCVSNEDCESDLDCFIRKGYERIPNCVTGGHGDIQGIGYCHRLPEKGPVTYVPGELSVDENGLLLSTGLTSRIIARQGRPVQFLNGEESRTHFHTRPDGAAVFENPAGGWIYVSNSEDSPGGVGAITFDSRGEVINYEMIATGTIDNCSGGKTYWNTWVTCEEHESGQIFETDPFGKKAANKTLIGGIGGRYESFAFDARDKMSPTFYVTIDDSYGPLVKFTPSPEMVMSAIENGDYSKILTQDPYGSSKREFLLLDPDSENSKKGTFTWTKNLQEAAINANRYMPHCEGLDVRNGLVYFTCKQEKMLFILHLDTMRYESSSTMSGLFDGEPDQVARILGNDGGVLYFCEDNGYGSDLHGRDSKGNFYTILQNRVYDSETTGLAFSLDNKHMYLSLQELGIIFDITRIDGYSFGGKRLDVKYHKF